MENEQGRSRLQDWIANEAIQFSLNSSHSLNAAVDRLEASLDDSIKLLGFGEPLHGSEEILILRNHLFERLVTAHGFSAIAIESSYPRATLVDQYVSGHGAISYDEIRDAGFGHGFGELAANRELVEWMRRYNAGSPQRDELRFYGIDIPVLSGSMAGPRQVIEFVLDYLASTDAAIDQEHRDEIERLLGEDAQWEDTAALTDPEKAIGLSAEAMGLRIEIEDLLTYVRTRGPQLAAAGAGRYADALHYLTIARQLLTFHAAIASQASPATLLGIRDLSMADNLAHIIRREQGRGKVLVFAHNAHLQRGRAHMPLGNDSITWWAAGAHLAQAFGSRYAVIGSAIGVSTDNGLGQPENDTLEAMLTASDAEARFIPTHRGRTLMPSEIAALQSRPRSGKNPSYLPLTPQSLADFDWFAVLNSSRYPRGGRPLPG